MISETFQGQLLEFINSKVAPISRWVIGDQMRCYLRLHVRLLTLDNGLHGRANVLDIANVSVNDNCQGQGVYSSFLEFIEKHAKGKVQAVYIENVLDSSQEGIYIRRGYIIDRVPYNSGVKSLYKEL